MRKLLTILCLVTIAVSSFAKAYKVDELPVKTEYMDSTDFSAVYTLASLSRFTPTILSLRKEKQVLFPIIAICFIYFLVSIPLWFFLVNRQEP